MDLFEYQGKRLFAEAGIPVARSRLATSIAEAREIAKEIGLPLVVKAQVLSGGRGKAGGVRMAADEMQLVAAARDILEMTIHGRRVTALLRGRGGGDRARAVPGRDARPPPPLSVASLLRRTAAWTSRRWRARSRRRC